MAYGSDWDSESEDEEHRSLQWKQSPEGRQWELAKYALWLAKIEEEELLQAVAILFEMAEAEVEEAEEKEKAKEEALRCIRFLF
jgi:hypothetical protein